VQIGRFLGAGFACSYVAVAIILVVRAASVHRSIRRTRARPAFRESLPALANLAPAPFGAWVLFRLVVRNSARFANPLDASFLMALVGTLVGGGLLALSVQEALRLRRRSHLLWWLLVVTPVCLTGMVALATFVAYA